MSELTDAEGSPLRDAAEEKAKRDAALPRLVITITADLFEPFRLNIDANPSNTLPEIVIEKLDRALTYFKDMQLCGRLMMASQQAAKNAAVIGAMRKGGRLQ